MKKLSLLLLIAVAGLAATLPGRTLIAASTEKEAKDSAPKPVEKPQLFATPEEAVKALQTAVDADDHDALRVLFGPDAKQVISGDKVQDAKEFASFAKIMKESCSPTKEGDSKIILNLGSENWPFPIPLVKQADGQWYFDTLAGKSPPC